MTDEIEVLVHISTSTTRQNDELFRSVASAYAGFEPHRIHRDERVQKRAKPSRATGVWLDADPRTAGKTATAIATEDLVPTASKESYGSFPSNVSPDEHHRGDDSVPDETERPVSRLAQLNRSYLSWRKSALPGSSSKQGQEQLPLSSDGAEDADTGFIEDSQSALDALQSQLRDTWSATSEDSSMDDSHDRTDDGTHQRPSRVSSPAGSRPSRIDEDVLLSAVLEDRVQHDCEVSFSEEVAEPSGSTTRILRSRPDLVSNLMDFSKLPTHAVPPPPAISVSSPTTLPSQVTKHLAAVKTNNPSRFKPKKIRRRLEPDERGYWLIDCSKWTLSLQQDFWTSLHEHVCSDRIGWGTTLHRESNSSRTLGSVRLYCWGEVVEHMWLLMWLCSQGTLSNLGSTWVDADGVAVVEMN